MTRSFMISANKYIQDINSIKPDLIFVAGWCELLDDNLVMASKLGTIGFHPSKLPNDRGRSVLAWQIEEGYEETALSMFYYNDFPDGGDIIAQETIKISYFDYIDDVLDKIDLATFNLMKAYFPLLRQQKAPRKAQNLNEGNFRRLRTEKDSLINWSRSSFEIYNKIRSISKPYPGAISIFNGKKYLIWRSEIINEFRLGRSEKPGTLIATLFDGTYIIKTLDSFLRILEYTIEDEK
ncbi:hypothetical protein MASR2M39_30430 [Ignavibacteriales bacterium]